MRSRISTAANILASIRYAYPLASRQVSQSTIATGSCWSIPAIIELMSIAPRPGLITLGRGNSSSRGAHRILDALRLYGPSRATRDAAGVSGAYDRRGDRRRRPACGPHHPRNDPKNRTAPALERAGAALDVR